MTDHHDPLDELASARLDGEASPGDSPGIATDAELTARIERLAAVRATVRGAEVPIDPQRRDQAIAAALAVYDDGADDLPAAIAGSPVRAPAPVTPTRWSRRSLGLAGIAAALAMLALAVPLIDRLGSGSHDGLAARTAETSIDKTQEAAGGGNRAADPGPTTTVALPSSSMPDLGPFAGLPDLAAMVRFRLTDGTPSVESNPTPAAGGPDATVVSCADEQAAGGPVLYTALAELDGRPVVVVVHEGPDGGRTIVVFDRQDCTTVTAGKL